MSEDLTILYSELDKHIQKEDHDSVLKTSERILSISNTDLTAQQSKIVSLIHTLKYDEAINFIKSSSLQALFSLEFAYVLLEKKHFSECLLFLDSLEKDKPKEKQFLLLKAQVFYKIGDYKKSFSIIKSQFDKEEKETEGTSSSIEDLTVNYLSSYLLSQSLEDINFIVKKLNSWESYFNYCLILLNKGKFNESLETLLQMETFSEKDEYNKMKEKNLKFVLIQSIFNGFDMNKTTVLHEEYNCLLKDSSQSLKNMQPYFYNNFLHSKKEKENLYETIKKLDGFAKNETLTREERFILLINKIILLIRSNKFHEAQREFKILTDNHSESINDIKYVLVKCYLTLKCEKLDVFERLCEEDYKTFPDVQLILLQNSLSNLSFKTQDDFQKKVISFVKTHFSYCVNMQFISFFVNFYESRHLKTFQKEFIEIFKSVNTIKSTFSKENLSEKKGLLALLGRLLYRSGLFEESLSFFLAVEEIDQFDYENKYWIINLTCHFDLEKAKIMRKTIEETQINTSEDYVNELVNEIFTRNKKEKVVKAKEDKKKKKKKVRFPKNFDVKNALPDPERWVPRNQRKKFKHVKKNKLAYQGASADNSSTVNTFKK